MGGRRIVIAGLGNVLMGDDGIGPHAVRVLQARYEFPGGVSVLDLGTPGPGLFDHLAGADAVILVDAVRGTARPGTLRLLRRADQLAASPRERSGPHDPALFEVLTALEMARQAPGDLLLVGVVPECVRSIPGLCPRVRASVDRVCDAVLEELERLGVRVRPLASPREPDLWWERLPKGDRAV